MINLAEMDVSQSDYLTAAGTIGKKVAAASAFCHIHAQAGDAYWFDNSVPHSVHNHSGQDRLALIVCIKTDQFKDTPHA